MTCPYCQHVGTLSPDAICGRCPCGAIYWNLPHRAGWERETREPGNVLGNGKQGSIQVTDSEGEK